LYSKRSNHTYLLISQKEVTTICIVYHHSSPRWTNFLKVYTKFICNCLPPHNKTFSESYKFFFHRLPPRPKKKKVTPSPINNISKILIEYFLVSHLPSSHTVNEIFSKILNRRPPKKIYRPGPLLLEEN